MFAKYLTFAVATAVVAVAQAKDATRALLTDGAHRSDTMRLVPPALWRSLDVCYSHVDGRMVNNSGRACTSGAISGLQAVVLVVTVWVQLPIHAAQSSSSHAVVILAKYMCTFSL